MEAFRRLRRLYDRQAAARAGRMARWDAYIAGKAPLFPEENRAGGKGADISLFQACAVLLAAAAVGWLVRWVVMTLSRDALARQFAGRDWYPDFADVLSLFVWFAASSIFLLALLTYWSRHGPGAQNGRGN